MMTLDIPLRPTRAKERAREIFARGEEAVVCSLRQTCLVHLLRDLKHVEKCKSTDHDWPAFSKITPHAADSNASRRVLQKE